MRRNERLDRFAEPSLQDLLEEDDELARVVDEMGEESTRGR